MIRAAIYARFSSELQNARSIDDQVELCRSYCGREGYAPVAVFSDRAMSGATTVGLAGLDGLLAGAAKQQFSVVVVEALDRLSRDIADLATIYKMLRFAGVKLRAAYKRRACRAPRLFGAHRWPTMSQGICQRMVTGRLGIQGGRTLIDSVINVEVDRQTNATAERLRVRLRYI